LRFTGFSDSEALATERCTLDAVCLHFPYPHDDDEERHMDEWHDFFLAQAGAAGVLTGLVFVGASINLQKIVSDPGSGLPGRAAEAVSGLVLVDYTPYDARSALTDEQWGYWKVLLGSPSEEALALYPDLERFDHQRNLREVLAAAPLKPMPLIVLSSDEPYDLAPFVDDGTLPSDIAEEFGDILFRAILEARADLVSQVPGARHLTDTHSGHYIHQEQPQLVIGSVREVAEAVRKKAWCKKGGHNALGSKNQGQCIKASKHARR
jgi:pimeloyl-ACP methyl ester carboxylesterase